MELRARSPRSLQPAQPAARALSRRPRPSQLEPGAVHGVHSAHSLGHPS